MAKSEHNYRGLKHRTRGDANPQGRPRVYFCCHPDDFERFFGPVTDEILGVQTNAAIWYYDPTEEVPDGPEFLEDLRQMQLFVIPVTSHFVYRESRARDAELPLAIEAHVPVLPIMQEDIPNRDFSRACGSLQTLNRYTSMSDPTAIPYEEKLKRFLQSVIVGDELAERVRAAFDAYVFLSYRKKDRAQAQRVMRLIHEDELCRDLAIWYDEFLVPGEDFHDAINDALRRCSVFSLVVTPHLLEPGNFVMREEYPAARDSGKPVVPVEAVETDRGELADAYGGIGDAVPADDRDGLSSRLLDSLREVALRENDQDPQHNFFIGLAYLTGIDVEVNHERALALITSAAEAGLPEAYERLVSMYNTGEGVERDYHRAIEWQERYVGMLESALSNEPSWKRQRLALNAIETLAMLYSDNGNMATALATYNRATALAESLVAGTERVEDQRLLLTNYVDVSKVHRNLGNLEASMVLLRQALATAKEVSGKTGSTRDKRNSSSVLCLAAETMKDLGDLQSAQALLEQSLSTFKELADNSGTAEDRRKLSVILGLIGRIHFDAGRLEEASTFLAQSLSLAEDLASETNEIEDQRALAAALSDAGTLQEEGGDPEEALVFFERALAISEALRNDTEAVKDRRAVSVLLDSIARLRRYFGDSEDALALLEQCLVIDKKLAEETGTVIDQRNLSATYADVALTRRGLGDLEGASAAIEQSVMISEALVNEFGALKDRRNLATALDIAGCICLRLGDGERALSLLEHSVAIGKALVEETEAIIELRILSESLSDSGKVYQSLGSLTEALALFVQSIAINEDLVKKSGAPYDQLSLSDSFANAARAHRDLGNTRDAVSLFERSIAIAEEVRDSTKLFAPDNFDHD